jgi:hypothetical protein
LQRKKQLLQRRGAPALGSYFDDDGIFGSGKASCPAITGSEEAALEVEREGRWRPQ